MVHTVSFLSKITLIFMQQNISFGHPLCIGNEMLWCKERHPLLLKCFKNFIICIQMIEQKFLIASTSPLWSTLCVISTENNPQISCKMSESELGYPFSWRWREWDDVLQGETYITALVSHNLPEIYKDNCDCFWQHLQAYHGQDHVITTTSISQVSCKTSAFGHPLHTGN